MDNGILLHTNSNLFIFKNCENCQNEMNTDIPLCMSCGIKKFSYKLKKQKLKIQIK